MRHACAAVSTWPDGGRLRPDRGVYTCWTQALLVLQSLHQHRQHIKSLAPHAYVSASQSDSRPTQPQNDDNSSMFAEHLRTFCSAKRCARGCTLALLRPPNAAAVHCMHGACAATIIADPTCGCSTQRHRGITFDRSTEMLYELPCVEATVSELHRCRTEWILMRIVNI